MPADTETCRKAAEHCRRLAAKEVNPVAKHQLLHLADEWLRLAQAPGIVPALNQLAAMR
jgi:hypothetical protein